MRPRAPASAVRSIDGVWVDAHTVRLSPSQSAITPRGSIGTAAQRPWVNVSVKVSGAAANTPSTSPWLPVRTHAAAARRPAQRRCETTARPGRVRHLDELASIGGDRRALRRHHGHRLPAVLHLRARQRGPRGRHRIPGPSVRATAARPPRSAGGQHGGDAGQRAGGRRVDRADGGVGVGTADEAPAPACAADDVVEVATAAAEQPRILQPLDPLAGVADRRGDRQPFTRGSTSPAISSSCSSPQSSGLRTI